MGKIATNQERLFHFIKLLKDGETDYRFLPKTMLDIE